MACISINWRLWPHIFYNPKWYGLPWLIATWRVYRLLQAVTSRFAALGQKYNCPFAKYCCSVLRIWNVAHKWTLKELTTMERTSWQTERTHGAESKDLKVLLLKMFFSKGLKGPRRIPEGRPGGSDVSPLSRISGLSVRSHFSIFPLLFFCLIVLLLLLSYPFLLLAHSPDFFFPKVPFSER